jgi:hypothetical protein
MKKKAWIKAPRSLAPWLLVLALAALNACSPSRYVRPLQEKQGAISATLGGPVFTNFGAPIPAPMTTLTGAYGFSDKFTGFATLHPTAAAFGVIQVDAGFVRSLIRPDGWQPGVSVNPTLGFAVDTWEGRTKLWPQLDLNAWWEYGDRRHYLYAGFSAWFELAGTRANDAPQTQHVLPAFQIGNVLSFKSIDFQLELKANNFTQINRDATISWLGIGGRGGLGFYLGVCKRFGGQKNEN